MTKGLQIGQDIPLGARRRARLAKALEHGMDGAYYAPGPRPEGFSDYLEKKRDVLEWATFQAMVEYYEVSARWFYEAITDDEALKDWLDRRAMPWEDVW